MAARRVQAMTNVTSAPRNTRRSRIRLLPVQHTRISSSRLARSCSTRTPCSPDWSSPDTMATHSHAVNHTRAEGTRPKHARYSSGVVSRNSAPVMVVVSSGIERLGISNGIERMKK